MFKWRSLPRSHPALFATPINHLESSDGWGPAQLWRMGRHVEEAAGFRQAVKTHEASPPIAPPHAISLIFCLFLRLSAPPRRRFIVRGIAVLCSSSKTGSSELATMASARAARRGLEELPDEILLAILARM